MFLIVLNLVQSPTEIYIARLRSEVKGHNGDRVCISYGIFNFPKTLLYLKSLAQLHNSTKRVPINRNIPVVILEITLQKEKFD